MMIMEAHYQMRVINPDGWQQGQGKFNLVLFISTKILPSPAYPWIEKMSALNLYL